MSVIASVAQQLDMSLKELLPDDIASVGGDTKGHSVPQLRAAVASYRTLTPLLSFDANPSADLAQVKADVAEVWDPCQASRFG